MKHKKKEEGIGKPYKLGKASVASLAAVVALTTVNAVLPMDVHADWISADTGNVSNGQKDGKKSVGLNPTDENGWVNWDDVGYLDVAIGNTATVNRKNRAIAIGAYSAVYADNSLALGYTARVIGNGGVSSIAIGDDAVYNDNPFNLGVKSAGQGVVIGPHSIGTAQATAVGNNVYAIGRSSIALGSDDNEKYRDLISKYDYDHYFKILYANIDKEGTTYGYNATNPNDNSKAGNRIFSPTLAQGDGSIAIGSRSIAYAEGGTALGTLAFALKKGATAVGTQTRSEGEGSIALGSHTSVFADNSVGTGNNVQILNQGGMAYGYKAYSGGFNSIAIGSNVYANTSMDFNHQIDVRGEKYKPLDLLTFDLNGAAKVASKNLKLNSGNFFSWDNTGYITRLEEVVNDKAALVANLRELNGVQGVVNTQGKNAIVIGSSSVALGDNSIALGRGAFALDNNSFAIGSYSVSKEGSAMAIGLAAKALADNSLAIGVGTGVDTTGTDAIALGTGSVNKGASSSLVGNNSRIWEDGREALLFGSNSNVYGVSNIGLGNNILIKSASDKASAKNVALGNNIIIGSQTTSSIAIGDSAAIVVKNGNELFPEFPSKISNAMALGYKAMVTKGPGEGETGVNSMAIGSNAVATLENSIALGVNSLTDYKQSDLLADPWKMPGALSVPTTANTGVVSVGSINAERRIVNVASGYKDTDAVNVAQLKMVADKFDNDISMLQNGGGVQYLSVEKANNAGKAGKLAAEVGKQANYDIYTKIKERYLSYQAREKLNGEKFNPVILDEYKKKISEFESSYSDFKSAAATLNGINPESGDFKEVMKQIQAAYEADKGKKVTSLSDAELKNLRENSNYLNNRAEGIDSIAFGYNAHTTAGANRAIAMGIDSEAASVSSMALGDTAKVNAGADNSVALGSKSVANAPTGNGVGFGTTPLTGATQNPTLGVVSIGDTNNTRRITNVAAGAADTDAVNLAQLRSLSNNKLYLTDDKNGKTSGITLGAESGNTDGRLSVGIKGAANSGISTQASGNAIEIKFDKDGFTKELKNSLGDTFAKVDASNVNPKAAAWRTALNVYDKGEVYNKGEVDAAVAKAKEVVLGSGDIEVSPSANDPKTYTVKLSKTLQDKLAKVPADTNGELAKKADKTDLDKKADKTDLANKADKTDLANKADKADLDKKADKTDLANKADKADLATKANTSLDNLTAEGTNKVKDLAGEGVNVTGADNKVTVSNETKDHVKTYKVTVNEDNFDKDKIKNLIGGVTPTINGTDSADDNKVTTAGAVKNYVQSSVDTAKNALKDEGFKVTSNTGTAQTVKLGKQVAVNGDGTTINGKVETDGADGAKVTLSLADTYKTKLDNTPANVTEELAKKANTDASNISANAQTWRETLNVYDKNAVDTAIANAKEVVVGKDGIEVSASEKDPKTYTVGFSKELKDKLDNTPENVTDALAKKADLNAGNLQDADVTAWKEKLGVSNLDLSYKANGNGDNKTTLANGLNFTNTDNITASVEANGVVKHALNSDLVHITSLTNGKKDGSDAATATKLTLTTDGVTLNNKKITGVKAGENVADAVNYGQLKAVEDKVKNLETSTGASAENKADKDLGNITDDGKNKVKDLAGEGVNVTGADNKVTVSNETKDHVKTYKVTVNEEHFDADKIKNLIGGVTSAIDPDQTTGDNNVTTAGAVKNYVKSSVDTATNALKDEGFKVASNTGAAQTVKLGKQVAVTGDGKYIKGTVASDNADGATVTLSLDDTYKTKLDNTPDNVTEELAKKANTDASNIDADKWKNALGVSNIDLSYKANGKGDNKTTLANGLNFTNTDNITASVEANGVVKHALNSDLVKINTLTNGDTKGAAKATTVTLTDDGVTLNDKKITGVKAGNQDTDAVNYSQLKALADSVGAGEPDSGNSNSGPAGKDGLNGENGQDGATLAAKVNALRDGTAGNMVYTDKDGNRLVAGKDGKYYDAKAYKENVDPNTGKALSGKTMPEAVKPEDVRISAVNPDGSTTKPLTIGNVASVLGLTDTTKPIAGDAAKKAVAGEDGKSGLLAMTGADLSRVATGADIQALAQAGLDFKGNTGDAIHKALGTALPIEGKKDATYTEADYSYDNVVTNNDEGTLRIALAKKPQFDAVKLGKGENPVTLTPEADGSKVTLSNGKAGEDGKVALGGLKEGKTPDSAVTKGELNKLADQIGAGEPGSGNSNSGPAGKDGLNGENGQDGATLAAKVNALRDGTAGNMVYTDKDGNRLVAGKDGKYYDAKAYKENVDPKTGKALSGKTMPEAVKPEDVRISAVNPDGSTTKPLTIGNVASVLGLTDTKNPIAGDAAKEAVAGKDGKSGLLAMTGADLSRVATGADIQALAQAGLDFKGNTGDAIHTPLGTALPIEGKKGATYTEADYSYDNVVTNNDEGTLRIALAKKPQFDAVKLGTGKNPVTLTPEADGSKVTLSNGKDGEDGKVALGGLKAGTTPDSAVTKGELEALAGEPGSGNSHTGLGGNDGLNGLDGKDGTTLAAKVNALRDGTAGNMVYTDKDGNRLVAGKDGKYYDAKAYKENVDPKTGEALPGKTMPEAVKPEDVRISAVNPDGSTTKPLTIGNVASVLGLTDTTKPIAGDAAKKAVAGEDGKSGLLAMTGADLSRVATGADIQALAQAGLDFKGNTGDAIHTPLGTALPIEGKKGATYTEADYSYDNVVTNNDEGTLRIALAKKPQFDAVKLGKGENPVTLTPEADGSKVTLSNGKAGEDGKVALGGLKAGTTPDSAVTKGELEALAGEPGSGNSHTGLGGNDGLNGLDGKDGTTLAAKVNALRDGTAGNMVYTDKDGNRLVAGKDGKYYDAKAYTENVDPKTGKPLEGKDMPKEVKPEDMRISAVNSDGSTTKPLTIGNVASVLGLTDTTAPITPEAAKEAVAGKDGKPGLLAMKGADLSRVATGADIQALAQAGLDFKGNKGDAIHKPLGTTLAIEGKKDATYDETKYSTDNLVTYNDNGTLRIGMLKNPAFDTIQVGTGDNKVTIGTDDKGNLTVNSKDNASKTRLATMDDGFKVKTKNGEYFLKLGGTLSINGDNNINIVGTGTAANGSTGSTAAPVVPGTDKPVTPGSGTVTPGANQNTTVDVTMSKTPTFDKVTLTGDVKEDNQVTTKKYVDTKQAEAKAYTDEKAKELAGAVSHQFASKEQVNGALQRMSVENASDTAAALAAAGIPQIINSNKRHLIGASFGYYKGQSAAALGVSGTNPERTIVYKVSGTFNSQGHVGVSAGIGFTFGRESRKPYMENGKEVTYDANFNKRIEKLEAENAEIKATNKKLQEQITQMMNFIKSQPQKAGEQKPAAQK